MALSYGKDTVLTFVHCDIDHGDMTFVQGHDTPFGHGQQLCKYFFFRSNKGVRNYGPDTIRRSDIQTERQTERVISKLVRKMDSGSQKIRSTNIYYCKTLFIREDFIFA